MSKPFHTNTPDGGEAITFVEYTPNWVSITAYYTNHYGEDSRHTMLSDDFDTAHQALTNKCQDAAQRLTDICFNSM